MTGRDTGVAPVLDDRLLDALCEVANIGCDHAAAALSKLMGGQPVGIEVLRARVVAFGQIAGLMGRRDDPVVAVAIDINGDLGGKLLLLLPHRAARGLAETLIGPPTPDEFLSVEARSAISEVANILGSVCLSAIAQASGLRLVPSIPRLAEDKAGVLLDELVISPGGKDDRVVVLETRFDAGEGAELSGHFLILPDVGSLGPLQRAIGL